jgi:penicillin-binding protein 2
MEFKNPQQELERFQSRLRVVGAFMLICFALLLVRFVWLQLIQYNYYKTRADENRISLVPITPNRGLILDRNGVVLARNYSGYTIEITPSKVANLDQTIDDLSRVINIEAKDRKRFKKLFEESKNFESLPIRTRVSDTEVARFIANRYRFPGVDIQARLFRQYSFGAFASHLLGYIGRVTDRDLEKIEDQDQETNYRGTDHFGKAGLEQYYEFDLHGVSGVEQVEVDAGGNAVRTLARTPPVSGNNLTLTVDAKLQQIAEKAFGDRKGALVAIEPSTGGVLALVSVPNYDPNLFVDGIDSVNWDLLNNSPDKPMVNRALNGAYPPGSTFKPYMALAALESGKRTPEQTIFDPGYYNFGGHQFRDDKKGGHGTVNMYTSIVQSCDTYYYMLANDLGIDGISSFMRQFGFGQKSGIDTVGESQGVLPSQEWKRTRFKRPEQQRWYAGETISIGIGQGYNAYTPMQLALAMSTLANNGVMYRPHLVKTVTDARTGRVTEVVPELVKTIALKPENIEIIKNAMIGVNKEGTGARAFAGAEYVSAGKTGTAQVYSLKGEKYTHSDVKEHLRDHALFIAFAPADKPKIALAILVENGGFGAQAAAPIARQIIDYYLLGKVPAAPAQEDAAAVEDDTAEEEVVEKAVEKPVDKPLRKTQ